MSSNTDFEIGQDMRLCRIRCQEPGDCAVLRAPLSLWDVGAPGEAQ
jgi:hypothetical protein